MVSADGILEDGVNGENFSILESDFKEFEVIDLAVRVSRFVFADEI